MLRVGKQLFRPGSDVMLAVLLFVATLSIFLVSRVHQVTDSSYSMLLSERTGGREQPHLLLLSTG